MPEKPTYEALEKRISALEAEVGQLRKTEKSLRERQEELGEIFALSPDMISISDLYSLTFLKVNPAFQRILGYTEKELLERPFLDFIHPEDVDPTITVTSRKLKAGSEVFSFINRYQCKDDTYRWLEWVATPDLNRGIVYAVAHDITEHKEAEESLRKNEAFSKAVMDNLPIGLSVISIDMPVRYQYLNDNFLKCFRTTKEALAAPDSFWNAAYEDPDFRKKIKQEAIDAFATGDPARMVWDYLPITRKGEETTYITQKAYPVPELGVMIGTCWDVTEQKRTSDALKETKRILEKTQAIAKLGGWEYDVARDQVIWMDEVYRIHGLPPGGEPLCVRDALKFYPPEHQPIVEQAFEKVAKHGEPYDVEVKLIQATGTTIWVRTMGQPVFEDGQVVRVAGFVLDITSRKEAEETLRKYERIVSASEDFLALINTDYVYEAVNDSFLKDLNKPRDRVIGHTVAEVMGEEVFRHTYRHRLDKAFAGKIFQHRDIIDATDKPDRILEITLFPMKNATGVVEGAVLNVRDITRTQKLEETVMHAQRIESIGRLAGGVAHDLNNLLTPIIAYGEMLSSDFTPSDARKRKAEQIIKAGLKARDLVHQLLAFSRKQTLAYKPIDMNNVLTDFEKLMRRTIPENIEIKTSLMPDIPTIKADVGQIEQVIMNLAVNAADAMPQGGRLTIETATECLDENFLTGQQDVLPGRYVMLAVSDTGAGIDEATQKHLFEPFFSTKGSNGTGLGLATVYGIIKQHKGNIRVYSEPGKGTTFKVYLPIFEDAQVKEEAEARTLSEQKRTETILLVEDNEIVRTLANDILVQSGHTVLVAKSGEEALAIMGTHKGPVDLLLTDIIMPGINGRELYEKIAETRPELKVLYMSGYTDDVIAHQGILDDSCQFIQKPFSDYELRSKIKMILDQKRVS